MLPDHQGLGAQAAGLLNAVAENGWQASDVDLEYPLSVERALDVQFARRKLRLKEQRLATIDRLVE